MSPRCVRYPVSNPGRWSPPSPRVCRSAAAGPGSRRTAPFSTPIPLRSSPSALCCFTLCRADALYTFSFTPNTRRSSALSTFGDFHTTIFIAISLLKSAQTADAAEDEQKCDQKHQRSHRKYGRDKNAEPQRQCAQSHTAPRPSAGRRTGRVRSKTGIHGSPPFFFGVCLLHSIQNGRFRSCSTTAKRQSFF